MSRIVGHTHCHGHWHMVIFWLLANELISPSSSEPLCLSLKQEEYLMPHAKHQLIPRWCRNLLLPDLACRSTQLRLRFYDTIHQPSSEENCSTNPKSGSGSQSVGMAQFGTHDGRWESSVCKGSIWTLRRLDSTGQYLIVGVYILLQLFSQCGGNIDCFLTDADFCGAWLNTGCGFEELESSNHSSEFHCLSVAVPILMVIVPSWPWCRIL